MANQFSSMDLSVNANADTKWLFMNMLEIQNFLVSRGFDKTRNVKLHVMKTSCTATQDDHKVNFKQKVPEEGFDYRRICSKGNGKKFIIISEFANQLGWHVGDDIVIKRTRNKVILYKE